MTEYFIIFMWTKKKLCKNIARDRQWTVIDILGTNYYVERPSKLSWKQKKRKVDGFLYFLLSIYLLTNYILFHSTKKNFINRQTDEERSKEWMNENRSKRKKITNEIPSFQLCNRHKLIETNWLTYKQFGNLNRMK